MNYLTQYFVPQWVSITFLISIPLPFILLSNYIYKETQKIQNKWASPTVITFFVFYLFYIAMGSYLGWFNQVWFPPKILLFATFPFAFLLFVLVLRSKIYQTILLNTSIESLVRLHIFRLIGMFFIILALYDTLPKTFAFIAGTGDVLTAISSVFVANAIKNKRKYAKNLTFYWNIFGTIDILFTAIAANILTKISIDTGSMGVDTLAIFPFCIIPAFAPPIILFLHLAIFKKLNNFSK